MTPDKTAKQETAAALVEHPLEPAASNDTSITQGSAIDNIVIRELAKRRLMTKRSLIGQAFDYLLIIVATLCFANMYNWGDRMALGFCLCAFWGLRLAYRVFKFAQPSFKEGVAAYFRKRKERQLEFEYDQLKKMSAEYVTHELSK